WTARSRSAREDARLAGDLRRGVQDAHRGRADQRARPYGFGLWQYGQVQLASSELSAPPAPAATCVTTECSPHSRHTFVTVRNPTSPTFSNVNTKFASRARSTPVVRWSVASASVNAAWSDFVRGSFIQLKPAGTRAVAVSRMPRA